MPHAVRFVPALALALALGGCASTRPPQANAAERLDTLAAWMSGIFTSEAQSKADAEFRNVRLVMYPIWTDRTDGKWLYAEQAVVESLDKPYRQRVYHLMVLPDGSIESVVYLIPGDATLLANAWQQPHFLENLRPDLLRQREGCEVFLTFDAAGREFVGGTQGTGCPSERAGASYATSEIAISDGVLVSWDRGFDKSGVQVWGATKGGYRFVRQH